MEKIVGNFEKLFKTAQAYHFSEHEPKIYTFNLYTICQARSKLLCLFDELGNVFIVMKTVDVFRQCNELITQRVLYRALIYVPVTSVIQWSLKSCYCLL